MGNIAIQPILWEPKYSTCIINPKYKQDIKYINIVMNRVVKIKKEGKHKTIRVNDIIKKIPESKRKYVYNLLTDRKLNSKYVENLGISSNGLIYLENYFDYYYKEGIWLLPEINRFISQLNFEIFKKTGYKLSYSKSGLYDKDGNKKNAIPHFNFIDKQTLTGIINRKDKRIQIIKEYLLQRGKSLSGEGSSHKATQKIVSALNHIIKSADIKILIDLAHGDLTWMRGIISANNITYIGNDVSKINLKDKNLKLFRGSMSDKKHMKKIRDLWKKTPGNTIILCREVFQHMDHHEVKDALNNIKQFTRDKNHDKVLFLATNYIYQCELFNSVVIFSGGTNNRNLFLKPWSLPPTCTIDDTHNKISYTTSAQKSISIWSIDGAFKSIGCKGEKLEKRQEKERRLHMQGIQERNRIRGLRLLP